MDNFLLVFRSDYIDRRSHPASQKRLLVHLSSHEAHQQLYPARAFQQPLPQIKQQLLLQSSDKVFQSTDFDLRASPTSHDRSLHFHSSRQVRQRPAQPHSQLLKKQLLRSMLLVLLLFYYYFFGHSLVHNLPFQEYNRQSFLKSTRLVSHLPSKTPHLGTEVFEQNRQ